ncbi:MAG: twin-arginine translocase subunit TatB [Rhodocyclaceae bacterium]|nr:twin-arginine translocase subunit TatB [Rhodocyclaceae bacterium]
MFDIGFSELMLISLVALIVIGPERLPKVARTVGHMLGRLQRYVSDVKSDIQREIQLDELKKLQTEMKDSAREFETSIRSEVADAKAVVEEGTADARASLADLEAQLEATKQSSPSTESPVPAADASVSPAAGTGKDGPQMELGLDTGRQEAGKA